MDPFVLSCVRAQVEAVLCEIKRIEGSEFPYQHARDALNETKAVFESHRDSLASISEKSDKDTAELACSTAFVDLSESIDLLGFLLRSTNIRNAFEAYGPMLRIARSLLGNETRLIVSSEWHFSPFTYLGYHYLPGVVLIGLPAPESSNPFLLPLAGHELGHTAWLSDGLAHTMEKAVEISVIEEIMRRWDECKSFFHDHKPEDVGTDLLARPMWKPAWDWALRQCEEHFCDFFGLRIFGEAYLYAFAYLIAPHRRGPRPLIYPNLRIRAACLAAAGRKYGLAVPDGYADLFEDLKDPAPEHRRESLLLSLADAVRSQFVDRLQSDADKIISQSGLEMRSLSLVESCCKRLALMVPAERSKGLANILNAAWKGWLNPNFFRDAEHNRRRLENLREVVLKSIEVLEIEMKLEVVT
jgi:hypothetical protein